MADGYETTISSLGKEGSVAVLADGKLGPLGFVLPKIAVLVKSNIVEADLDITESELFLELSNGAFNGLFVSWSGFTDIAQRKAHRSFHQAKFWNIGKVAAMLKENYEKLSDGLKLDLPLRQVWAVMN